MASSRAGKAPTSRTSGTSHLVAGVTRRFVGCPHRPTSTKPPTPHAHSPSRNPRTRTLAPSGRPPQQQCSARPAGSARLIPTARCGTSSRVRRSTASTSFRWEAPVAPRAAVRPVRAGAWDIRSLVNDPDAKLANEVALVDLDGGVTSLWLAADETTDVAATLAGVLLDLAPVVLDAPPATSPSPSVPGVPAGTSTPTATSASTRSASCCARCRSPSTRRSRSSGPRRPGEESDIRAIVVDATAAHDLGASDAQESAGRSRSASPTCAGSPTTASPSRTPPARSSSATRPPTSSSRRSPSCARHAPVGEGAPGQRGHRGHRPAPARGHQPPDVQQVRPLRQHASRHCRRLRCRCGRCRCGDHAALDSANGRPDAFGRRIARNTSTTC